MNRCADSNKGDWNFHELIVHSEFQQSGFSVGKLEGIIIYKP